MINTAAVLFDDLDNPVGARIDQDRPVVHDGVAIIARAIFRRYFVIGDTFLRQHRADSDLLAILIGRATLLDGITAKAGAFIDAENSGDAADHAANYATDDGADRTGCSFAIPCASLNPAGDPLGLHHGWQRHGGDNGNYSDKAADHDISNGIGKVDNK
jgi:hypothetical protein